MQTWDIFLENVPTSNLTDEFFSLLVYNVVLSNHLNNQELSSFVFYFQNARLVTVC